MAASSPEWRGPDRHFDPHCQGDVTYARSSPRWLPPEQSGSRDVSAGRTFPQVPGEGVYDWQEGIAAALQRGQAEVTVRRELDAGEAASFLIATYEGYVTLAKNAQDARVWKVRIQKYRRLARLSSRIEAERRPEQSVKSPMEF